MFRSLINLRALKILAQMDLDLSVRSALRIIVAFSAAVLGAALALAPFIHGLGGSGFVFVGCKEVDRVIVLLAVLWVAAGTGTYAATRSWITETAENISSVEEFGCRALLGADVLSVALVERLIGTIFSMLLLMIVSIGALLHASPTDTAVLTFGVGIGIWLYCQSGRETLTYLAQPERKNRNNPMFRMLVPICFASVVVTSIWGYRGLGRGIYVPQELAFMTCCLSVILAVTASIRLAKTVRDMRGCPLGLPLTYASRPITMPASGVFWPRTRMVAKLFIVRPLFSGIVATRWPLAMMIVLAAIDAQHLGQNIVWIVAFALVTTLQTVSTLPDLLLGGRALRFYYEERGGFPSIFAAVLLTRTLVILPQSGVMMVLWHLVSDAGGETPILAALAVIGDVLASGIAGSSHQRASQYSIAMAALMSFAITAAGMVFLRVAPAAAMVLAISALVLAYLTWRKNVAYIA